MQADRRSELGSRPSRGAGASGRGREVGALFI